MIEFKVNNDHTAIVITFKDSVDAKQTEQLHDSLQNIIPKLKRGFKLLTDLSFMEKMDIDAHLSIEKLMQLCNQCKVSQIIRIIPDTSKDVGFNIMSMMNYSPNVNIVTYRSTEEALKAMFLKDNI
ncbi:MAG: hypothetical protein PHQ52_04875 [Candidatus Omnitrophica bacterium]|nr:hypothetical protein [Candidatus Omnitrophota bacterium]